MALTASNKLGDFLVFVVAVLQIVTDLVGLLTEISEATATATATGGDGVPSNVPSEVFRDLMLVRTFVLTLFLVTFFFVFIIMSSFGSAILDRRSLVFY